MKTSLRDINIKNKKVIVRVDFNVPIKDGVISDDNRIMAAKTTISHLINNGAKVILLSHLGRVKKEADKAGKSLAPVAKRLSEIIDKNVIFINETQGKRLESAISNMKNGDVLLAGKHKIWRCWWSKRIKKW